MIPGRVRDSTMGMSSVVGIAKDYIHSLKSARDGKMKPAVVLTQICLPIAAGVVAALVRFGVPNSEGLVTGVSIVAALMCSVGTLPFQIRIDLRRLFESKADAFLLEDDIKLVDELFAQVMWSILSGFLLALILVMEAPAVSVFGSMDVFVRTGFGLVWCLVVNFILTVGVVLKRMRRVYVIVAMRNRNSE